MFESILSAIAKVIVIPLVFLLSYAGYSITPKTEPIIPDTQLGANITSPVAGTVYSLSGSGVSGSATSIGLTSLTIPQTSREIADSDVSDTFYITLEPGNRTRQEIVSCTTIAQSGSDTTATLSGCTRGLLPFYPYTASTTYQFAHGGGTSVVFSNPPQLYEEFISRSNNATVSSTLTFLASSSPRYSSEPTFTGSSTLLIPTVNYVNTVATSGAPDASLIVKGLVEIADKSQLASGSSTDNTTAPLIARTSYYNATSSATTTVPVTGVDGKLSSSFIATSSDYLWTGSSTFTGSTTISGETRLTASTSITATTTFTGKVIGVGNAFGGDGTNGALSVVSGSTTTLNLTGSSTKVFNYTSISVVGTLAFSNPHASGTVIIIKSQGAVTISGTVNATSTGALGGAGGIGAGGNGKNGGWLAAATSTRFGGLGGDGTSGIGGVKGWFVNGHPISSFMNVGSGGGAGQGNGTVNGGNGGDGSGGLLIESGGALNFTGTINANGINGSVGANGGGATGAGGGGGGSGGSVLILYNTFTTNTGTINVGGGNGGNGGTGGVGNGGIGGGGAGSVLAVGGNGGADTGTAAANGTNSPEGGTGGVGGGTNGGEGGGGGAAGWRLVIPYINPDETN